MVRLHPNKAVEGVIWGDNSVMYLVGCAIESSRREVGIAGDKLCFFLAEELKPLFHLSSFSPCWLCADVNEMTPTLGINDDSNSSYQWMAAVTFRASFAHSSQPPPPPHSQSAQTGLGEKERGGGGGFQGSAPHLALLLIWVNKILSSKKERVNNLSCCSCKWDTCLFSSQCNVSQRPW